jgi:3-dehydroquinate dehydratase type I
MVKQGMRVAASMTLPLVCVSLRGNSIEDIVRDANRATAANADLVEVRFDNLYITRIKQNPITTVNKDGEEVIRKEPDILEPRAVEDIDVEASIAYLKNGIQKDVIFTCRSQDEDGHYPGDEKSRAAVLIQAIESGVSWVDLEVSMDASMREDLLKACGDKTQIIASVHARIVPTTEEIIAFVEGNTDAGTIIKGCWRTGGHSASLNILEASEVLAEGDFQISLMGDGPGGDWVRIHAPPLNQALVYTTLDRDHSLFSQGRININDLKAAWELLDYKE